MVKSRNKIILIFFLSGVFCLFNSCNNDLLGLFYSSDLDERLAERDNFRFLTASDRQPSLSGDFKFIVLTDTHIENGESWGLNGLKDVITADTDIKFIVVLGDITQYGASKDLNTFINFAKSLGIPCYPVIGNHDIYNGNWIIWKDLIGSTRYRIDAGGATLFILDSANAFFGKEQYDWLKREIQYISGKVFVFTHTNLFLEKTSHLQLTDTNERSRIVSILKNKCDIMFMGHSHERWIYETGGVKYINIEDFKDFKVYCLVSVTGADVNFTFEKL